MYNADIGTFAKYSSQNYVNQYGAFNGNFRLPFGYINVQEDFDHTSDRADTEFIVRSGAPIMTASAALGVKFNKLALETGYADAVRTYVSNDYAQYDYLEDMISETVYYQLFPKTKALVEYDHGWITYNKDSSAMARLTRNVSGLQAMLPPRPRPLLNWGIRTGLMITTSDFQGLWLRWAQSRHSPIAQS